MNIPTWTSINLSLLNLVYILFGNQIVGYLLIINAKNYICEQHPEQKTSFIEISILIRCCCMQIRKPCSNRSVAGRIIDCLCSAQKSGNLLINLKARILSPYLIIPEIKTGMATSMMAFLLRNLNKT
ncbi:hypothetical protein POPTR_016G012450v4 [Populus trichocarpa]|jgi:hypothetical protein|uniref:Uncharacterized protein n=1 Tax=Populus trichocarpa TaxID=3694 RepID=A0ACC0RRT6_POPTR|nr:hypothetical protein POPTR_016G012450v4 [Populus trichocarpa]